jgi:small GTP-binding protein
MSSDDPELVFKFILVGDSSVGKTCICKKFCDQSFDETERPTVHLEFGSRMVNISGHKIKLNVWDTAGQERFRSMTRAYFRGSQAVFLVFDVTNRNSFNHLDTWADDAHKLSPPNSVKVLVGNKVDLQNTRAVATAEGEAFADRQGLKYFETSALSGHRIDEAFLRTADAVYAKVSAGTMQMIEAAPVPKIDTPSQPEAANEGSKCRC